MINSGFQTPKEARQKLFKDKTSKFYSKFEQPTDVYNKK